jgi:drug/metabolite transporter (DMT)-like permease
MILKIFGVILILAGVAALIYGGFTFTTQKKAVDMGPVQINKTEHHSVPLPPILGVVAIIGGGALFYFGAKEGK